MMIKFLFPVIGSLTILTFCSFLPTSQVTATTLRIYSSGSLKSSLMDISQEFTHKTRITLDIKFGPSGIWRQRIEQELKAGNQTADIFFSGDDVNSEKLYRQGLSSKPINFASNHIVAVFASKLYQHKFIPSKILDNLLRPEFKLGIPTPLLDAAGDYVIKVFAKAESSRPGSGKILLNKAIRLGIRGKTHSILERVNSLSYILDETQEVDILLALYTNAFSAQQQHPKLQVVELPDNLAVSIIDTVTVIKGTNSQSKKLVDFILSPQGQRILRQHHLEKPISREQGTL